MAEKVQQITPEEIQSIRDAKNRAVLATAQAERAVAVSRVVELEANNLILSIYNKYGLVSGQDNIMESGQIIRQEDAANQTNTDTPIEAAPLPEETKEKIKEETNG